ncbi:protein of unknown function [Methanoculleus bourgensis]|uniref:Uncharacterized protein n=1 Tax=Methanoculleus bourgensis TaxID=83986 RepID=A0A0X3BNU0_9EURY|nr:protein of unknown function [Methanoculleus bourgensis]
MQSRLAFACWKAGQPCFMHQCGVPEDLMIPIGIIWYLSGKIKTVQYNCFTRYLNRKDGVP